MKEFGLQLYSIRNHFTNYEDTAESFRRIKEYGYSYAQTAGDYAYIAPADFKALADAAGIEILSTHFYYDRIINDIENTMAYHDALGTNVIGISSLPVYARESIAGVDRFVNEVSEVIKIYAEKGFSFTYHNHSLEFKKLEDGRTIYDHLIEKLDPSIKFVLDIAWVHLGGADVYDLINRLNGRIFMLHLKDVIACAAKAYTKEGKEISYLPERIEVGCGNINFPPIIKAAEAAGCEYFVVEDEIYSTGESYDSVRISAENIKAKLIEK